MVESFAPLRAGLCLVRKVRGGGRIEAILDVAREQKRLVFRARRTARYRSRDGEAKGKGETISTQSVGSEDKTILPTREERSVVNT